MKKGFVLAVLVGLMVSMTGTALAFPVDFSGDYNLKFNSWQDKINDNNATTANTQVGRLRLNFSAPVDKEVTLFGRLGTRGYWGTQCSDPYTDLLDQYGVKISAADWEYSVGRQEVSLGQGAIISTGSDVGCDSKFDGLVAAGKLGTVSTQFIVGKTTDSSQADYSANWWGVDFFAPLGDNLTFGVTGASEKIQELGQTAKKFLGVNATFNATENLALNAEYIKSNADSDNKAYFIAGTYSWDKDWFSIQYNHVGINAIDQGIGGIGNIMYPINGNNLDLGNKYSGFTYTYNHQMSKAAALNVSYMSLKTEGYEDNDSEYAAYVEWAF
jgi:hypothetical protein